jgi:hypothetical protein
MPDEFDHLLDASLKRYVEGPQHTGLEERILIRARSIRQERRMRWYLPVLAVLAVPALAAFLLLAVWPASQHKPVRREPMASRNIPAPHRMTPVTASVPAAGKPKPPKAGRVVPLLRAHGPLTVQEQLLLQVAATQPEQMVRLSKPMDSIAVPLLEIQPLLEEERN